MWPSTQRRKGQRPYWSFTRNRYRSGTLGESFARHPTTTVVTADGTPTPKGLTVSSLTDASSSSLLSPEALSLVRAPAPVVAANADQITAHFYPRMFNAHPELLRVFNQGNQ